MPVHAREDEIAVLNFRRSYLVPQMAPEAMDVGSDPELLSVTCRDIHFPCAFCVISGRAQNSAHIGGRNLVAVDAAARIPVFRPLIGADKMDILATAHKIGTYEISSEPFHDCCPVFMPRKPSLYASPKDLDEAESKLNVTDLIRQGLRGTTIERFVYNGSNVEASEPKPLVPANKQQTAIA